MNYKARETFGLSNLPDTAVVPGFEPGLPNVPTIDPDYVFSEDTLRDLTMFWYSGHHALLLEGDPSAGKTSLIEQWHARLHVPLFKVACTPTTENWQLYGQLLPRLDGQGLVWHDGPVLMACRGVGSLLLDEQNLLDPGVASGLNMILEGYEITIPETGEVVRPPRTLRFFAAQNPVDSKAIVAGRNVQDVAFEDRWSYMYVDYLGADSEKELIARRLKTAGVPDSLAKQTATIVVDVGQKVRQAFREDAPDIDKPLSTRVLLRWAKYAFMYRDVLKVRGKSSLHYGITRAVRMTPTMAKAVEEMVTLVAGFGPDLGT